MYLRIILLSSIAIALVGCNNSETIEVEQEPLVESQEQIEDHTGPVTECDENLSSIELKEVWEVMNASVYDSRNICFSGFVVSNDSEGDLIQGTIAFDSFTDTSKVIPAVHCEFTGNNASFFANYNIGDPIEIMGRLRVIEDREKHNFKLTDCSLPTRHQDIADNE